MPPKKGSKKKNSEKIDKTVVFSQKEKGIESFAAMANELHLQESYKSLLLGIAVVLLVTVLLFGYLKNRTPQSPPPAPKMVSTKIVQRRDVMGVYTVQAGDDLKSITLKYYNTSDPYMLVAKDNGLQNPDQIDEGKKLTIPKIAKTVYLAPSLAKPLRTEAINDPSYTVQDGDVLWDIAVRTYGDGYKWQDILKANNLPSTEAIFPGMILQLPR